MSGDIVEAFRIEVEVVIREWHQDEGVTVYDWIADHGDSDELFETIEDAKRDAIQSLGG